MSNYPANVPKYDESKQVKVPGGLTTMICKNADGRFSCCSVTIGDCYGYTTGDGIYHKCSQSQIHQMKKHYPDTDFGTIVKISWDQTTYDCVYDSETDSIFIPYGTTLTTIFHRITFESMFSCSEIIYRWSVSNFMKVANHLNMCDAQEKINNFSLSTSEENLVHILNRVEQKTLFKEDYDIRKTIENDQHAAITALQKLANDEERRIFEIMVEGKREYIMEREFVESLSIHDKKKWIQDKEARLRIIKKKLEELIKYDPMIFLDALQIHDRGIVAKAKARECVEIEEKGTREEIDDAAQKENCVLGIMCEKFHVLFSKFATNPIVLDILTELIRETVGDMTGIIDVNEHANHVKIFAQHIQNPNSQIDNECMLGFDNCDRLCVGLYDHNGDFRETIQFVLAFEQSVVDHDYNMCVLFKLWSSIFKSGFPQEYPKEWKIITSCFFLE